MQALRASGSKFIEPVDDLCIAATQLNETPITAVAPALLAGHAQHIELADEVSEYDRAVAGHSDDHRIEGQREKSARPGDQIAIGLRPMRAARFRTCRIPSPAIFTRSPFFKCLAIKPGEILKNLFAVLFGELMLFRQSIGQLLCADRLSGRRLGCGWRRADLRTAGSKRRCCTVAGG